MIVLGGLPTDPPVDSAGLLKNFQLCPLSSVSQASIQCSGPSLRRMVVRILVGDSRTDDGMMAKPAGSGPIHDTRSHVLPPSVVRVQNTRPSRPFSLDAVMKAIRSYLPLTM